MKINKKKKKSDKLEPLKNFINDIPENGPVLVLIATFIFLIYDLLNFWTFIGVVSLGVIGYVVFHLKLLKDRLESIEG